MAKSSFQKLFPNPRRKGARSSSPQEGVAITYKPHKNQYPVHIDKHRYRVLCAGRRFGKSVFSRQEIVRKALMWKQGKKIESAGIKRVPRFWIVSPTFRQGREVHWLELKEEIPKELVENINNTNQEITLANGTIIELKGAENEENLRGAGLVGVVLDECSYMKPHVWPRIIEPMLLETRGWAVFVSTPDGPNWFKDIYLRGVENSSNYNPEWKSWHFTSYDNPFVDPADLDKKKKELPEEEFQQEYMAEFVTFKDLVYKDFDFDVHVIKPFDLEDLPNGTEYYRGIDFGFRHATVCLWIAVTPEEKWYVIEEYYAKEASSEHNVGVIKSILPNVEVEATWGDPSATQLIDDYEKLGLFITAADRSHKTTYTNWVKLGISKIASKLKTTPEVDEKETKEKGEPQVKSDPSLFIFNNCENLIREFQSYRWKVQPDVHKSTQSRPLKRNDDALDSLRYFAVSYDRPFGESSKYNFPKEKLFRKGGFYQ